MNKVTLMGSNRKFMRMVVADSLAKTGHSIIFEEDFVKTIRTLAENPVNLIILDLDNFVGVKPFISHLQSSPSLSRIPLIVIFSDARILSDSGAEMSDVVAYVRAPFSSADLTSAIRNVECFYLKSV
jgi:CheY-like chemotaxis protein